MYRYTQLSGYLSALTPFETEAPPLTPIHGSWSGLIQKLQSIHRSFSTLDVQESIDTDCKVKIILLARHCEGTSPCFDWEHNTLCDRLVPRFGTEPDGDAQRAVGRDHPLFDPGLSAKGMAQAGRLAPEIQKQVKQGMPLPRHFVSPARRAVQTWSAAWGISSHDPPAAQATVIEDLRERLHMYLCNARRSISVLLSEYPSLIIPSMTIEEDPYWQPGEKFRYDSADNVPPASITSRPARDDESDEEIRQRAERALGQIMQMSEENLCVCLTSHASLLYGVMDVLGVKGRHLQTGEMCAVVLMVEQVESS